MITNVVEKQKLEMLNYQNSKHSKQIGMYKQNKTHKYFMSKTP